MELGADQAHFLQLTTVPVGSYPPNRLGIHDMHGNVAEWCEDVYDPDFYASSAALGPDPTAPADGFIRDRVVRGGSWGDFASECRSGTRDRENPRRQGDSNTIGFRVAFSSR